MARETFLPGGLRLVVFFLLLSWIPIACSEPTTTPAPPGLSPAIQTAAAAQPPLTTLKPGAFPTRLLETTAPPATAIPTQAETQGEFPVVQIYRSRVQQLRYDPREWEAVQVAEGMDPIAGAAVYQLVSRSIPGCILQENVTRGDPASWSRKVAKVPIGNLQYRQEMWTSKNTGQRLLAVYQYPASSRGKRFEVVMKEKQGVCNQKAREVLSLSEDLIAAP